MALKGWNGMYGWFLSEYRPVKYVAHRLGGSLSWYNDGGHLPGNRWGITTLLPGMALPPTGPGTASFQGPRTTFPPFPCESDHL